MFTFPRAATYLTGLIIFSLNALSYEKSHAKPPVKVFAQTLKLEPHANKIEALGVLRANEAVTLSATVTETVRAIHFEDGQRVNKGDVLVEMTSSEEHAFLEEARSSVAEAERQYKRVQSLVENKLANESLLDQRLQILDSARANLLATQSRLEDRLIVAPFSGVVGLRQISVGALVTPGDVLTTLDDNTIMKLDIAVPEPFLGAVGKDMQVQAFSVASGKTHTGIIQSLDSRIDPNTRTVTARAFVENARSELKPGMVMSVSIAKPELPTLFVQESAVIQIGHQKFVYLVDGSQSPAVAKRTEITASGRVKGKVAVLSGLSSGDMVVTDGTLKIQDGSAVTVIAEDSPGSQLTDLLSQRREAP